MIKEEGRKRMRLIRVAYAELSFGTSDRYGCCNCNKNLYYVHEKEDHRVKGPSHCSAKKKRTEFLLADSAGQGDDREGEVIFKVRYYLF